MINQARQVTYLIMFDPIISNYLNFVLKYYCMLISIQCNLNSCFKFIDIPNSFVQSILTLNQTYLDILDKNLVDAIV